MAFLRGGSIVMTGAVVCLNDALVAAGLSWADAPGYATDWLSSVEARLQTGAAGRVWFGYYQNFLASGPGPGGFLDAGEAYTWAGVNLKAREIFLYGTLGDRLYVTVTS